MAVVTSIFNGLEGNQEVHPHYFYPKCHRPYEQINIDGKPLSYTSEPIAPKLMPNNIETSTRRNVLPCKGITHHVLRRPPVPAAGGMVPPTGIARHEKQGLAYLPEKPLNLPILHYSNPYDSALNNPLGKPD